MPRFRFELAMPHDGPELLEILEEASFSGNLALLYTRRPDAYASLQQEGHPVDIIVCRDTERQQIVGFGAGAIRAVWINGVPTKIGYLFGLRTRLAYRKKYPLLNRGYAFLYAQQESQHVPFYLTTILTDNLAAQRLLERRRADMPAYQPFGAYTVSVFKTTARRRALPAGFTFQATTPADLPDLLAFLTCAGQQTQFFPVIREANLKLGLSGGLRFQDFYLLRDNHQQLVAAGAVWDQTVYKQYVMQGYAGVFKWLYRCSRGLPLLGLPALPAPGSVLSFFTLAFWTVRDHQPELCRIFLAQIARVAPQYPFFLVGLPAAHPLHPELQRRPHLSYRSQIYLVSWEAQRGAVENLNSALPPYLECGLL
jgi:hypothetical protein